MKVIWKFGFEIEDRVWFRMPEGAQFLTIQMQEGQPVLWALVDTDRDVVKRHMLLCGTGHDASEVGRYIATFQMHDGQLAFHAFEDPTDFIAGPLTS